MKNPLAFFLALVAVFLAVCALLGSRAEAAPNSIGPRWVLISDQVSSSVLDNNIIPTANALWSRRVSEEGRVTVDTIAVGNSGYVYNPTKARMAVEGIQAHETVGVILSLGTNDFGTGQVLSKVTLSAQAMVLRLRALGVQKVVCLTPLPRYDQQTRRGPNPGQMSALGHTLTPVLRVNRATYSSAIAFGCFSGGADVVMSYLSPLRNDSGTINVGYFTSPLPGTTLYTILNSEGHRVFAQWLMGVMRQRGHWQ